MGPTSTQRAPHVLRVLRTLEDRTCLGGVILGVAPETQTLAAPTSYQISALAPLKFELSPSLLPGL
jgi:hypothetical protein